MKTTNDTDTDTVGDITNFSVGKFEFDTENLQDNISLGDNISVGLNSIAIDSIAAQTFSLCSVRSGSVATNEQYSIVHKGEFTTTYCLDGSEKKNEGDTDQGAQGAHVAIKVLNDDFYNSESVSLLNKEYNITKQLSKCSAVRSALMLTESDGVPAIVFEW
eukprot:7753301-Ditylum_brightwellii.AAC.1